MYDIKFFILTTTQRRVQLRHPTFNKNTHRILLCEHAMAPCLTVTSHCSIKATKWIEIVLAQPLCYPQLILHVGTAFDFKKKF